MRWDTKKLRGIATTTYDVNGIGSLYLWDGLIGWDVYDLPVQENKKVMGYYDWKLHDFMDLVKKNKNYLWVIPVKRCLQLHMGDPTWGIRYGVLTTAITATGSRTKPTRWCTIDDEQIKGGVKLMTKSRTSDINQIIIDDIKLEGIKPNVAFWEPFVYMQTAIHYHTK